MHTHSHWTSGLSQITDARSTIPVSEFRMDNFLLFDFDSDTWRVISSSLQGPPFESLKDYVCFINSQVSEPCNVLTVNQIVEKFTLERYLEVVNFTRATASLLQEQFPSGNIQRLNSSNPVVSFTRRQVLTLLCNMFLCTLKESRENVYWVTFKNWLTDGRSCASAYLESLLGYFESSKELLSDPLKHFYWNEVVTFERHQTSSKYVFDEFEHNTKPLLFPTIYDGGKIGDSSTIEVDFANKDIGFGTYGTQEEILFGASPEMCIAMLFCDTMDDNECTLIKGARKVGNFEGYGSCVKFKSFVIENDKDRNNRILIAIDALDFSVYEEDSYAKQFSEENLRREIGKLLCGFGALPLGSSVDTGNWGCGAFCGDKYLKAVLQVITATLTNTKLSFYTFGDTELYEEFQRLCDFCDQRKISVGLIWNFLENFDVDVEHRNVFTALQGFV